MFDNGEMRERNAALRHAGNGCLLSRCGNGWVEAAIAVLERDPVWSVMLFRGRTCLERDARECPLPSSEAWSASISGACRFLKNREDGTSAECAHAQNATGKVAIFGRAVSDDFRWQRDAGTTAVTDRNIVGGGNHGQRASDKVAMQESSLTGE
jgi:hypothetical protein